MIDNELFKVPEEALKKIRTQKEFEAFFQELYKQGVEALLKTIDAGNPGLVIIDEVQKVPQILDVVHKIMEERKIRFILTGSGARKLKKAGADLLGGRAVY